MFEIYPCRVVITSNSELARHYNEDPESALMASYCLTVEEAFGLLEEQRTIETIVLVNGAGESLICRLTEQLKWDRRSMPDIVRIDVLDNQKVAAIAIRRSIYGSSMLILCAG